MEWEKEFDPAFSVLKVKLNPGEVITAEAGAMVLMKGDVKVKTEAKGGILKALGRKLFGGGTFFMNDYYAEHDSGEVWLVPALPGDIAYVKLDNSEIHVQDLGYLAHHGNIDVGVKFKGFKGFFGAGEVIWLRMTGTGGVWISGYGGVKEIDLGPGEKILIDNFHALAIEHTVKWKIRKFGGIKSFLFGGEGLIIEAEGPGKVYVQTRILPELIRLIAKYISR